MDISVCQYYTLDIKCYLGGDKMKNENSKILKELQAENEELKKELDTCKANFNLIESTERGIGEVIDENEELQAKVKELECRPEMNVQTLVKQCDKFQAENEELKKKLSLWGKGQKIYEKGQLEQVEELQARVKELEEKKNRYFMRGVRAEARVKELEENKNNVDYYDGYYRPLVEGMKREIKELQTELSAIKESASVENIKDTIKSVYLVGGVYLEELLTDDEDLNPLAKAISQEILKSADKE